MVTLTSPGAEGKASNADRAAAWCDAARRGMLMAYVVAFGALVVLRGIDIALRG